MKKSYVYFVAPLVALVIFFFGFYWNAHKDYEKREAAKVKAVRDARQKKLEKEAEDRAKAVQAAVELQEKRRGERKAREEKDAREKEDREKARQAREKAARDADKFEAQVRRLQKEIEAEKKDLEEVKAERKRVADEETFLKEYVKKAEANAKGLTGVLERIAAADKAAEDAARAAAAAAAAAAKK
jgi:colicin import membrane protein